MLRVFESVLTRWKKRQQSGGYLLPTLGVKACTREEARRQFRSEVLSLLSLEVYSQVKKFDWLKEMRRGNRRLRSLALHLRSITSEIERTYNNPGSDAELLGWILQLSTEFPVIPASKRPPVRLLKDMRGLAVDLESKARAIGNLFRRGLAPDVVKRRFVFMLLVYLQYATGNVSAHLRAVAEMLHCSYELCGIKKPVTIDSLYKVLKRHVMPSLRVNTSGTSQEAEYQ